MKFSLGPILYFWDRQRVVSFYDDMKDSDFDIIYLGETVCSKRRELKTDEWIELAKMLHAAGKEVVLSTMALLESRSELSTLKRYCDNGELRVEANDVASIQFLSQLNLPFVLGAAINIYNQHSLKKMLDLGMQRWVMPVELSQNWLSNTLSECNEMGFRQQFESEVYAYGHLPLAYSARCFTARSEGRPKDDCQFCCKNYPAGRKIKSQEDEQIFVMNGIQTMSGKCYNLINELDDMQGLVDVVRISPENETVTNVLAKYQQQFSSPKKIALDKLQECNGYWNAIEGMNIM